MEQVVEALQRIAPGVGIAAFDGERWTVTQSYFEVRGMWPAGPVTVAPATGLAAAPCCALGVADLRLDSPALVGALAEAGVGPEVATITYAGPQLLDVVPASVDKGYGIRRACELLDIGPAQVLAFGDGPNDLALFRAVGLSVAVAKRGPLRPRRSRPDRRIESGGGRREHAGRARAGHRGGGIGDLIDT